ncbi:hypothetical protein PT502_05715 [Aliarcobacter butzleri]|uniref:hypothetical protein n=1 Tax=Aliarcobacter butzleri TaxID=28197 RepID=UPI0024DEFA18|nr:hypothetical protein [Aliarcobacter butzleri]MDK2083297.1 hypothetical protein [Aliarcobacter butzleri]
MNLNYDYIYQLFIIVIDIMDKITILVAFITLFFVIRNWLNNRKQLKAIKIYFFIKYLDKKILIDDKLTRKDARRSEIQGVLGNKLIKGVPRYDIDYLSNESYFNNVFEIQNTKIDELIIEIDDDEIGQFSDLIVSKLDENEIQKVRNHIITFIANCDSKNNPVKLKDSTKSKLDI